MIQHKLASSDIMQILLRLSGCDNSNIHHDLLDVVCQPTDRVKTMELTEIKVEDRRAAT